MLLIICGHPRSGTTLLQTLCDYHPQMAVTNEFGTFSFLNQTYWDYARNTFDRWKRVQGKWAFDISYAYNKWFLRSNNLKFTLLHLWRMRRYYHATITLDAIQTIYRETFPSARIWGDKWPHYLFQMERFIQEPDLKRLVIYRDCRDVTSSFLKQARTNWAETKWVKNVDTAEKIATRWVRSMSLIEQYVNDLFVLRYEDLVQNPCEQLKHLSNWIGVEDDGFNREMISDTSIGKHEKGLTAKELDTVLKIAGPTMERYGYL